MDLTLNNYILFWIAIIGLCLGSFFNVVILRSLNGESIVFPASKCPQCGEKLKPWHNIPVFSYIFLRGKCAFCKNKISIQYPIIELVTMFLFILCYIKFGLTWQSLFLIIICSSMLIMSVTDLKEKLVDCNIAIALAIIGLLYHWFIFNSITDSIYGLLAGILIFEIIARTGYLFVKSRAMGEADTYIAGALGACFGLQGGLFSIIVYTLFAALIFIVPMFLYKQIKIKNKLICITAVLFALSLEAFRIFHQNTYSSLAVILTGILLSIAVLKEAKTENSLTYIPLVPAFFLGVLYFLFF